MMVIWEEAEAMIEDIYIINKYYIGRVHLWSCSSSSHSPTPPHTHTHTHK